MSNKIKVFIIGLYLAVSIGVSGSLYINPTITYDFVKTTKLYPSGKTKEYKRFFDVEIEKKKLIKNKYILITNEYISYRNLKYSILISVIGFIVLLSILQLFPKKQNRMHNSRL